MGGFNGMFGVCGKLGVESKYKVGNVLLQNTER